MENWTNKFDIKRKKSDEIKGSPEDYMQQRMDKP